jgi:hypothetical protein
MIRRLFCLKLVRLRGTKRTRFTVHADAVTRSSGAGPSAAKADFEVRDDLAAVAAAELWGPFMEATMQSVSLEKAPSTVFVLAFRRDYETDAEMFALLIERRTASVR